MPLKVAGARFAYIHCERPLKKYIRYHIRNTLPFPLKCPNIQFEIIYKSIYMPTDIFLSIHFNTYFPLIAFGIKSVERRKTYQATFFISKCKSHFPKYIDLKYLITQPPWIGRPSIPSRKVLYLSPTTQFTSHLYLETKTPWAIFRGILATENSFYATLKTMKRERSIKKRTSYPGGCEKEVFFLCSR